MNRLCSDGSVMYMRKTIVNPLIRDEVTFTQTAAATNGRITSLLVTLMPGGGTPIHYHRSLTKTFIVLEGELTIDLKRRKIVLVAGQDYSVAKKEVHRFSNQSEKPVLFTTIIRPGSSGFENALCILYGLAGDKRTDSKGIPVNKLELAAISEMSDMHQAGAKWLLTPLLRIFSIIARITRVHKKLIAQYCIVAENRNGIL